MIQASIAAFVASGRCPVGAFVKARSPLRFEQNPLDKHADLVLDLKMEPLDVVVNKPALEKIGKFFSTPDEVDVTQIKTRAVDSINKISAQTRDQLPDS